jgi:hypothetical protein
MPRRPRHGPRARRADCKGAAVRRSNGRSNPSHACELREILTRALPRMDLGMLPGAPVCLPLDPYPLKSKSKVLHPVRAVRRRMRGGVHTVERRTVRQRVLYVQVAKAAPRSPPPGACVVCPPSLVPKRWAVCSVRVSFWWQIWWQSRGVKYVSVRVSAPAPAFHVQVLHGVVPCCPCSGPLAHVSPRARPNKPCNPLACAAPQGGSRWCESCESPS